MSIKLLDKNVINQISAGEVVEKPASVVKELVENSIDAGANKISIEIKNGGKDYICVTDNGCGIKKDEVELAFTPHATSKLENIDDLNSLSTMGFRGEALATISAVSQVTMVTKTTNQDTGIRVCLEGGEKFANEEVACVTGTKIEVENIFYNTPARLKFLRKSKTEENDITSYVEKLILANAEIVFEYIVDGKLIYNTLGGSVIDNIYTIYGKELATNMLVVDFELGGYIVKGYISKPEYNKANRSYQSLFVNGRYCNNALISTAVSNAYENFTMKGKFPVYCLYLKMPQSELDVNVHPNKLEVKFENNQKIYRVFNDAVFKSLSDFNHIRVVDNFSNERIENSAIDNDTKIISNLNVLNQDEGVSFSKNQENNYNEMLNEYSNSLNKKDDTTGSLDFRLTNNILPQVDISANDDDYDVKENLTDLHQSNKNVISTQTTEQKAPVQEDFKDIFSLNYKLVGVAFDTYLILEFNNNLYLIDQHAAHERQKYDEIMKQLSTNSLQIQDLMVPFILKVSQTEANFLNDNMDTLNSFGIDIAEFGYNTYRISSVPLLISEINLGEFFENVFENLNALVKTPQQTIKEKFMQMACKSAVKGGEKLSDLEIKALLKTLQSKTETLLCPHGRPIVVEITKNQIEKWFKRIVWWKR